MLRTNLLQWLLTTSATLLVGQPIDSTVILEPVIIKLYPSERPSYFSPSSISAIGPEVLDKQSPGSLLPSLNTVAGVRMEERSPGSYRVSIRGSLLRAPFGVRNIKVYLDAFPLTDAGGNTYLNILDPAAIKRIEILKGPEGSIYGANTGGVLQLSPWQAGPKSSQGHAGISGGSYGLLMQHMDYEQHKAKTSFKIFQGIQKAEGYRRNSAMSRYFLQGLFTYHLHDKLRLKLLSMYSDLRYATPGGLTEAQADTDPRMARPKAGPVPSAETQRAAIYNRYGYVGLAYEVDLSKRLQHTTSLFGNTSDFRNPFITNYEVRDEKSIGLRTTIKWSAPTDASYRWQWYSGLEWQKTYSEVDNYGNRFGNKDTLQVSDGIRALQHFYFTRCILYPSARWTLEAALSLNFYSFQYKTYAPRPEAPWHVRRFQGELMPKWALAYTMTRHTVLRASLSRGFSPPTLAELRPSDNQFYTGLRAESGWNYELGLRMRNTSRRASLDAAFFYFVLNNTIVRQTNSNGAEYFVNAGRTSQPGMEVQVTFQLIKERLAGLLRNLELRTSYTGYKFTFSDYISNKTVYSGKRLTGIPAHTCVTGLSAYFSKFYVFLQHNFTSKIPLNDANTVYANSYHLIQAKVNYTLDLSKVYRMSVYLGMDNLMNVRYSLGNDLNAFGGRYYNPAPLRNVYVGIMLSF